MKQNWSMVITIGIYTLHWLLSKSKNSSTSNKKLLTKTGLKKESK